MDTLIRDHERFKSNSPKNALTVDVEDYFQVSAFERSISRDEWGQYPCRVQHNIERILEIFERINIKGTFFTLGWIAERFPHIIKSVADANHEIASHGYHHIRVTQQTPEQFRDDVTRTKKLLEDITGQPVLGYRAATFSINSKNLWALNVLEESGYAYSSSIYPINHDFYGMPEAPRFAFRLKANGLLEVPITTVDIWGRRWPSGGGGYFRLMPYGMSRWALRRVNRSDHQPSVFYFHPWELDPGQPRIDGVGWKSQFRHYCNLDKMEARLIRLFNDFRWDRVDKVFSISEQN